MDFEKALEHVGHDVEVAAYGDDQATWNVAIQCLDCGSVIADADNPEMES